MKKIVPFVLILFSLISFLLIPEKVNAATFDDINQSAVFVKQQAKDTCTLASAVMMVRRAAMATGNSNWAAITESSMKGTAWKNGSGLYYNFTYAGIKVSNGKLYNNSSNVNKLIELLQSHPEGVVIYDYSKPHAILLTDYTNGTFYCADPANSTPSGRIPITSASITINSADAYWYVASPQVNLETINHNPTIYLDGLSSDRDRTVSVCGWAYDPDNPSQSIWVHVYLFGQGDPIYLGATEANILRPDLAPLNIGTYHGYAATFDVPATVPTVGNLEIGVAAINIGEGNNIFAPHKNVTVYNTEPLVAFDGLASEKPGTISVAGWAYDPNDPTQSLLVQVYLYGHGNPIYLGDVEANINRPDLAFLNSCTTHGYAATFDVPFSGKLEIGITAKNIGAGSDQQTEHKFVNVTKNEPVIVFDNVTTSEPGTITVSGWAYDPKDISKEVEVVAYIFGDEAPISLGSTIANKKNEEIDKKYHVGTNHGFECTFNVPVGGNLEIGLSALNDGQGDHGYSEHKTITVTMPEPEKPETESVSEDESEKQVESVRTDKQQGKNTTDENIDSTQKKTSLTKLKAGAKSITVSWKKVTGNGIKGYELQYSTDKNFKKDVKSVTIKKVKKTSTTLKKLKSKKKYYVRIRTYKQSGSEKIYSNWSKTKNVKVK
jgi:hypothetical protein